MTYRSKKDVWLFGLVWGMVTLLLFAGLLLLLLPGGPKEFAAALLKGAAVGALAVLLTTYPLNYEITTSELVARSGFMRWRVPLADIEEVSPTRSPLSAPAWSLDRLNVSYRKGAALKSLLISPEDKARFMSDLAASAPDLEVRGDRVVRAP